MRPAVRYPLLAVLLVALGLGAYTVADRFTPAPEAEPPAASSPRAESASPRPEPSPTDDPAEPDAPSSTPTDPAAVAEAMYKDFGVPYLGAAVTEEVSLGLCGQFPDPGVGTAYRELIQYGGYTPEDAGAAVIIAAAAYCPEHRDAVEEWSEALGVFQE